jgi:polyhydroxybutyrate depolymerase
MDGRAIARWTGLARRGPAAGITTVFPNGWKGAWHAIRPPDREPDLDDTLFLSALSSHLEVVGAAESWPVFLAGMSHGALFAEHVARHGLLPVAGLFLVAGSALEASRRLASTPRLHTTTTLIMGTGDRVVPYHGGPLSRRGISGLLLRRRAARHGELPGEDVVAGAEDIAAEWAAGNGIGTDPSMEELPGGPLDQPVTRTTWTAPGCRPVTLYRVNGGGQDWPGGTLDATALLLGMAERESAVAAGYRTLERLSPHERAGPVFGSWPVKENIVASGSSGVGVPEKRCAPQH